MFESTKVGYEVWTKDVPVCRYATLEDAKLVFEELKKEDFTNVCLCEVVRSVGTDRVMGRRFIDNML